MEENAPGILRRRSRAAMRELRARMQDLARQGFSRVAIARALGVSPSQVTYGLGPIRQWKTRRVCST